MRRALVVGLLWMVAGMAPFSVDEIAGDTGGLMSYSADGSTVLVPQDEGVADSMLSLDISGIEHLGDLNDPGNVVLAEALGPGTVVTGIGWDVVLTTVGFSWLSEAVTYVDGSDLDGAGLLLSVGAGMDVQGTAVAFSSGGIIDLTDQGIPNIPIQDDGRLYLQFWESFVDNPGSPDAYYEPPSTYDIVGLGFVTPDTLPIPTLSTIGIVALLAALAVVGVFLLRR